MKAVSIFDAKTHFSSIIQRIIEHREEVIITRRGEEVARLSPVQPTQNSVIETLMQLRRLSHEVAQNGY